MAVPRAVQFIALRNIARGAQQTRHLHMLPPAAKPAIRVVNKASDAARSFTTTPSQKASRDSSTIDFFYFPDIDHEVDPATQLIRVPILPDNYNPPRTGAHAPEAEIVVHKSEINAMSLDSVFLPMAELHDGHAMGIDFHAMADRVAANVRSLKVPVEEQAGIVKQLFNDMIDDVMGLAAKKRAAS